jgi:hypothetical protein
VNELAPLQAVLADLIRRPSPLAGSDAEEAAGAIAAGNERLSPVEQVDVYREQFFLRHVGCLREDFASIERLLGEDAFEALATAYLAAHPPTSYDLADLGHAFARFVAETAPYAEDPLLADLARVEWAFVEAFDGPDAPALDLAVVAAVPEAAWPRAHLALHPSARLLALAYPSADYRVAARTDEAPPRPEPRATNVVVFRGQERLQFLEIEPTAFALLSELSRGVPLGEACERASAASFASASDFEAALGGWFSLWTQLGWIVRVDVD